MSARLRKLGFSLLPLAALAVAGEAGLRLAGWQGEPDRVVSWCREHAIPERPYFPRSELADAHRYRTPRVEAQPRPWADGPPAAGVRRIFAFGGSAVHGYGFTRVGSWPDKLEERLAGAWGEGDVEVINAGVIAFSSQQVLMLAKEALAEHGADALVIYSGNNELLEWFDARRYLPEPALRRWVAGLTWGRRLRASRLYRLGVGLLGGVEVGYWGQTEFTDDEALPWAGRARLGDADRAFAAAAYRYNIGRVLELADAAGVPVVLSTVGVNYEDPPGEFEELSGPEPPAAREALEEAEQRLVAGELEAAEAAFERGFAAWPEAIVHYRWAQLLRREGRPEAALVHYRAAVALDENTHRAPAYINAVIRELGGRAAALVDGEAVLAGLSEDGITDWDVIYDYCHPRPSAHDALADAFAVALTQTVWPGGQPQRAPKPGRDHVDGWYGPGVDPENGPDSPDPGTERRQWWTDARAQTDAEPESPDAWNARGVVAWHTFHADCARGELPCLEHARAAFAEAAALDPGYCPAWANLGRLEFAVGHPGAGAHLARAAACDPQDARSAWYLQRLEAR